MANVQMANTLSGPPFKPIRILSIQFNKAQIGIRCYVAKTEFPYVRSVWVWNLVSDIKGGT
jgi:hypothetical protein